MMAGNPVYSAVPGDIVGDWKIHLPDGIHTVEFEHGTTSGKRVIRVDGNEVRLHSSNDQSVSLFSGYT